MATSLRTMHVPVFLGLGLSLNVLAASIPRQVLPCTFSITATGPPDGIVKQDTGGGLILSESYPQFHYLLGNGTLTDERNHTCLIEKSNSQFMCVQPGVAENTDFSFSDGLMEILHDGSNKWLACPGTGTDAGGFLIYSDEKKDTTDCKPVSLRAGGFGCSALGRPDPKSSSSSESSSMTDMLVTPTSVLARPTDLLVTPTGPVSTANPTTIPSQSGAACPKGITGQFQFPHLIISTSSEQPNYAFGNSYSAYISSSRTSIFNFDIPAVSPYTGTCALLFLFPYASDMDPSSGSYTFSGTEQELALDGGLNFSLLSDVVTNNTTYANTPPVSKNYGKTQIIPGNSYTAATFPCQSGKAISIKAESVGKVALTYFQNSAPSPIGLYIVPCA